MNKYEYDFVEIPVAMFSSAPQRDFREVIEEKAEEGWRFVQLVQPTQWINTLQLIFERELAPEIEL